MKTLIELFDSCQIENVIAALSLKPEKIVFIGFKEVMTYKKTGDIKAFFESVMPETALEFEVVGRFDIDKASKRIEDIVKRCHEPFLDITGGKELILTAMGEIAERYNIPIVQLDIKGRRINYLTGGESRSADGSISAEELIALNGGRITGYENSWVIDDDFYEDILSAWEIAKNNCGLWNRQTSVFGNMEKYGETDSALRVKINLKELSKRRKDVFFDRGLIEKMEKAGLISDYDEYNDEISFTYKNESVRRLVTKSGNVLELYAYVLIGELPEGLISDSSVGVLVDWDGITGTDRAETRNEIDIMLMKGFTPVFISCKNGEVYKDALYELDALARKFGGEHAEKIMLTTYVSSDEEKKEYIKKRAYDMGIKLIWGIEEMTKEEFKKHLTDKLR